MLISLYTHHIFPILPSAIGGGRNQNVMLVVKPDQIPSLNNVGLSVSLNDSKIGPFEVIYEASDYFIFSATESTKKQEHITSIKLKKDMFDMIFYVDPEYKPTPIPTPSPTAINH
jgi:hypothetical protein